MPAIPYRSDHPDIHPSVFIAPNAWITGRTSVAENASIFFGAVLRGDIQPVIVGADTNIQEHALLHTSTGLGPCRVGSGVTIGHGAIVHGCTVSDNCIIGMGATILDGAAIGAESIVGAQALVPMNFTAPPRSLILGVPAKIVRTLTEEEVKEIYENARHYVEVARVYREQFAKSCYIG